MDGVMPMILIGGMQNIKSYQDNHDLSFMQIGLAEIAKVHTVQTAKNILRLYMVLIIFALTAEQI